MESKASSETDGANGAIIPGGLLHKVDSAMSSKSKRYSRILEYLYGNCWAVLPEHLAVITEIVESRALGIERAEIEFETASQNKGYQTAGSTAFLSLHGTITHRANLFSRMSGMTSTEMFGRDFEEALEDKSIRQILIDVDSPGGAVPGVKELSDKIYEARGNKRIIAVANHLMASAAYWIASAADEIVSIPSGVVGSVGVIAIHTEYSKHLEDAGIKATVFRSGSLKGMGNPYEALSKEATAVIQQRIEDTYSEFVDAVARNRGVSTQTVRNSYGSGRVFLAREAMDLGLIDSIETFDDLQGRLFHAGSSEQQSMKASQGLSNLKCTMDVMKRRRK